MERNGFLGSSGGAARGMQGKPQAKINAQQKKKKTQTPHKEKKKQKRKPNTKKKKKKNPQEITPSPAGELSGLQFCARAQAQKEKKERGKKEHTNRGGVGQTERAAARIPSVERSLRKNFQIGTPSVSVDGGGSQRSTR